jgi:tyrosine aminotransferase
MSPPGARDKWQVVSSNAARNTHNPIRSIIENLRLEPNPEKPMIALSIGEFLDHNLCSLLKHV